jgi:hypothetical protein
MFEHPSECARAPRTSGSGGARLAETHTPKLVLNSYDVIQGSDSLPAFRNRNKKSMLCRLPRCIDRPAGVQGEQETRLRPNEEPGVAK